MVGLTSQINNWLLNPQSYPSSAEKVRKQSQECPLMANEKKNDFILNCDFMHMLMGFAQAHTRSWSSKLTEYELVFSLP